MDKQEDLEWLEALEQLEKLVYRSTSKNLSEAQKIVLRCAWDKKQYKEMASSTYSDKYLQHTVAPGLWDLLSSIFGTRIVKKDVRTYLEKANSPNYEHLFQYLKVLGGKLPDTSDFYGREKDLAKLENEVLQQEIVVLVGDAGIGKSLLATKMLDQTSKSPARKFELLLWKSIVQHISIQDLVEDLLNILNLEIDPEVNFYKKTSFLINQLRKQRCLIVLDGFEIILQSEFQHRQEYVKFFRRVLEEGIGACFLLTSRVSFQELQSFASRRSVKHLQLFGLNTNEATKILKHKGVKNLEQVKELVENYRGNPSHIEELARTITHYFGGDLQQYLRYKTTIVGERLTIMLHNIFGQPKLLTNLQRSIMIYLAQELSDGADKIGVTTIIDFLKSQFYDKISNKEIFSALKDLEIRLLIEPVEGNNYEICYKLQPGIKKYILSDPLGFVNNNNNDFRSVSA